MLRTSGGWGRGVQSGVIILMTVYRLAQSGEICSGIVGRRNGKSRADDNTRSVE